MDYDVAIAGLGVHGAAAARALAARGLRVIGLDARRPPHTAGSSHGRTRIIRSAYFEHPLYVPIVRRAFAAWEALEREAGRPLLRRTGGLNVGPAHGHLVSGTLASCTEHDLEHERLDAADIRRRFPAMRPAAGDGGVLEAEAGILFAEPCVAALLDGARAAGATIRTDEAVLDWSADEGGVVLRTAGGAIDAGILVLAAGAWLPGLARVPDLPLAIERQTHHWFDVPAELSADRCPVLLWEYADERVVWAVPDVGDGLKAGLHQGGAGARSPEDADRVISADDVQRVRARLERHLAGVGGTRGGAVCLYTNTPDRHFLIDVHPTHDNVVIVSACSGHGFKFAPALAELVADLATGAPAADLAPFRFARLGA